MNMEYQYLASKLEDALATDPRVNALDVKVRIRGDKIHLTGDIPTEERRGAATQVVTELASGLEVLNELTVYELNPTTSAEAIHA
jgi:osmotically-inducible protein OsmY